MHDDVGQEQEAAADILTQLVVVNENVENRFGQIRIDLGQRLAELLNIHRHASSSSR